jgi:hypothetical protein
MEKLIDNLEYTRLRKEVGTQAHVAKLPGIGLRTIQRRESGELPITREAYIAMMVLTEDESYEDDRKPVSEGDNRHRVRHQSHKGRLEEWRPLRLNAKDREDVGRRLEQIYKRNEWGDVL